jgi:hypothetical protein
VESVVGKSEYAIDCDKMIADYEAAKRQALQHSIEVPVAAGRHDRLDAISHSLSASKRALLAQRLAERKLEKHSPFVGGR